MLRHMHVQRDKSVLRVIEIIIVCFESVDNSQTPSKDGTFATCEKYDISSFIPFQWPSFHLSIDSSMYHMVFNHVTVFLVFIGKSQYEYFKLKRRKTKTRNVYCIPFSTYMVIQVFPLRINVYSE